MAYSPGGDLDQRLREVLGLLLGIDPGELHDGSGPNITAHWDSVNHLRVVLAIEEEFGIQFASQDILDMHNLALIKTIMGERQTPTDEH
jgi:acyl carrier protein